MSSEAPAEVKQAAPKIESKDEAPKKSSKKGAGKKQRVEKAKKGLAAERGKPAELPEFVQHRIKVWEEIVAKRAAEKKSDGEKKIQITLPNGSTVEGIAGVTTAMEIAKKISSSLANRTVVARLDGTVMYDLLRPLEDDCKLELLDFESKEGQHTFWHSSAHILGQSLELLYQDARLCIGPPLEDGGFYYDVFLKDQVVLPDDFAAIEKTISGIQSAKQPFQRLQLKKEEALELFKHNPFKCEIISNKVPDGETCTAYRCGPLIDLCKGPHVPNTGSIKCMAVTKNSSAYWLGKAENPTLQRVYGISFPDKKLMEEYKERIRLAEERDHRRIGVQQKLYFFSPLSPGSCFWLPHGARVYNKLIDFIKGEYRKRGYHEVVTPNVYHTDLWRTSGHYENYKDNMFLFECEKQEFGIKPMNCPGHCVMFGHTRRSYRDLPWRVADFGVLHRNEFSGALTGLTRVRRFQQDDAHIFCRADQIEAEINGVLDFLQHAYGIFGFEFELKLSTRPEKYLGEVKTWDEAEAALTNALNHFGKKWDLNPGDGAFYGPKIDIQLMDALKRKHQCATIQLDFQLPRRFELEYVDQADKPQHPVMIHRAILGSVERMTAVLVEHYGGRWPFWLSPRQVAVLPVSEKFIDYARAVGKQIHDAGYYVDIDESDDQVKKKVREAQVAQYNLILVVGADEVAKGTVMVRNRDDAEKQFPLAVPEFLEFCKKLTDDHK